MKMGINHVEKNLESTQKLFKVSVHGRTDKWVWHADLEGDPSRLENTEDIEEMDRARTDSEDSYLLNPVWSSPLVKCVDSSPLVIVRYYNPSTPPLSGSEGKEVVEGKEVEGKEEDEEDAGMSTTKSCEAGRPEPDPRP